MDQRKETTERSEMERRVVGGGNQMGGVKKARGNKEIIGKLGRSGVRALAMMRPPKEE